MLTEAVASTLSLDPSAAGPLLKIAFLLATGISVHLSLSPPNPPAPPKQLLVSNTIFERWIRYVTFCSKALVWLETVVDTLSTALLAFPSLRLSVPLTSLICPISSPLLTGPPHIILILGALATILGASIRLACFRALGQLFTFELTINPAHTLITTGPYTVVRHPSYAGVYLTLLGASAVGLAPGSWLRECGLRIGWGGALVAWALMVFWTVKVTYALLSTNERLDREDRELKRVFGTEWDKYAARVPWKLVPWVW